MYLYMGHYLTLAPASFHIESYRKARVDRLLQVWPRGYGKSVTWSIAYPLWVLLTNPYGLSGKWAKEDIIQISNTASLAEKWIRFQKRELTDNPRIMADFEPEPGEIWRGDEYTLSNGGRVLAKGAGAQIRGEHPTELVIDDLENREEAASEGPREKMKEYFFQDLWGTLRHKEPGRTRVKIVGTFVHPEALLPELYDLDWWERNKYAVYKPDNTPLWPDYMDEDGIETLRKQMPETAWASEYLNEPIVSENPVFRVEQFQRYSPGSIFSVKGKRHELRDLYIVTAIDPAITQRDGGDETAIVTVGAIYDEKEPRVFTLDARTGHWGIRRQISELLDVYNKFPGSTQLIETVAYQKALYYEYKERCDREGLSHSVVEIIPDKDKGIRANTVRPFFDRRLVYFDFDDVGQQKLINQLKIFDYSVRKHGKDDLVDALVYCLMHIDKWLRRQKHKGGAGKKPQIIGFVPDGTVYGIRQVANG